MKNLEYYLNLPYKIIIKKLSDENGGGDILLDTKIFLISWEMGIYKYKL
nr:hypothetical protein [Campylobacter armoricus]